MFNYNYVFMSITSSFSIYSSDTIRLLVGSTATDFNVHKLLLCDSCPFFDRALNGQFREGGKKEMELPEDEPEAFHEFLSWLYRKEIFVGKDDPQWLQIFKVWVLGDKLQN